MKTSHPRASRFMRGRAHRWAAVISLVGAGVVAGCATHPYSSSVDPYEASNRKVFAFNEALDAAFIKPITQVYTTLLPTVVQNSVSNFINNIKDVWSLTNLILQGQGQSSVEEFMRIGVNTTFGMGGLVDVATSMNLDRHNEDFGQTLAVWGAPDGAYLVLPFFGPSTTRDTVALPFDQYAMPASLFKEPRDRNATRLVQILNARSQVLYAAELLDEAALDKYAFVRDAYLQRRRNQIYNGEPPEMDQGPEAAAHRGQVTAVWTVQLPNFVQTESPPVLAANTRVSVDMRQFFPDMPAAAEETASAGDHWQGWSEGVDVPQLPRTTADWQASAQP